VSTEPSPSLFDPIDPAERARRVAEGERGKQEGMQRAFDHASISWKEHAITAARAVADHAGLLLQEFTSDDVWALLDKWGIPEPREPRALGAVMKQLVKEKRAMRTDQKIKSIRPQNHRREIAVYVAWRRS
jgi:hypothetical protein